MKTKIIITLSAVSIWFLAYFLIQNNFICFDKVCENTKIINALNFQILKLEKKISKKQDEEEKLEEEISKKQDEEEKLEEEISDLEKQVESITDEKIWLFKENNEMTWWWKRWMGDFSIPTTKEGFLPPGQVPIFSTETWARDVGYEVVSEKKN